MAKPKLITGTSGTRLTDRAYDYLRGEIISGSFRPNERLVELELAARLEISRTPIREALQRLAHEGLVQSKRRGWVVLEHSGEAIRQIYDLRIALESYASRLAAEHATEKDLERIAAVYGDRLDELAELPRNRIVELNERFHEAIVDACGNPMLSDLIRRTTRHYFSYKVALQYSAEELTNSGKEHARLLHALRTRDAETAEQITRKHLQHALQATLRNLWVL